MINAQSSAAFAEPPTGGWARFFSGPARATSTSAVATKRQVQEVQDPTSATVAMALVLDTVRATVQKLGARSVDTSVHAGQLLSDEVMEREKFISMIFTSITRFASEEDSTFRISQDTAKAAIRFIGALGNNYVLPKIAPDGEDALMAVWDEKDGALAVVLENDRLHVVAKAGTAQARYFDDLPFDGTGIPDEVLKLIPAL